MLTRIIIAVSITLFILTIIEVGYLFLYQPSSKEAARQNQVSRVSSSDINYSVLNYLNANKDILASSVVKSEYRGIVKEALGTPGIKGRLEYEKGLFISPVGGKSGSGIYMLFRKTDLEALKIYKKILGVNIPMIFSDLKPGDELIIEETIDLFADPSYNRLEIEIIKL
ncbi:MAG: hypothetical protein A3C30_03000 [Candidatus Levybacteria bacterium RIFCSPHIGHO2_02_FULL_40_18]|nr:MAG: hypothetical protein A2869_04980 [Candidatus Levybacteria bacterium RIFCSPHIGHO2_01_FULL_40_58]OGH26943.1 MAG: hypothetical protein A3C30_03000 [Candidatus Levybacteria bacterium RIFCSPHIGHO2_02_FULL_40_18]OGH32065.1 MAG: hypothetical protein A3E43_03980 [Candidatus Levybacteria bacterium RIFCSPHIGHO2_12_FULL_40_31]OGH40813.1 MAG: hypothetical protein A2894_04420 [Candidatus Levybacteria bacterium RIFCSPLOWO2_01_FULL_40_64]OGH48669.1 MAG: hypothetical protein A3I54_03350 [Candidatus Lev